MTFHEELAHAIAAHFSTLRPRPETRAQLVDELAAFVCSTYPQLVIGKVPLAQRICEEVVVEREGRVEILVPNLALWLDPKRAAPEVAQHIMDQALAARSDSPPN